MMICKAKVKTTGKLKTAKPALQAVDLEFAGFDLEFGFEAFTLYLNFAIGLQGLMSISSTFVTNRVVQKYYFITLS